MSPRQKLLQHLSWRAGFGDPLPDEGKSIQEVVVDLLKANDKAPERISAPQSKTLLTLSPPGKEADVVAQKAYRRQRSNLNRTGIRNLNESWLQEMFAGDCPLREKMALFWHGHFACRIQNVNHQEQLLQIIREQAVGNFGTLLINVSKSAAMLQFLNNQKNKKAHPNENFGREVMELFTMGRGNYTERDVKEGSRAFTGWSFTKEGDFILRKKFHDEGQKTFLGKTGLFSGEEVLGMLLDHKATARHITGKLYGFLVNDQPDEKRINLLADKFYQANYDIKTLLGAIFTSDWFYDPVNRGARIKSPVELLVGMERQVPVRFQNNNALVLFQRIMGQTLFYPPNVAGWPGGKSWIDSTTLMFRMRLPQIIYYAEDLYLSPKEMPEEMDNSLTSNQIQDDLKRGRYLKAYGKKIGAEANWTTFLVSAEKIPAQGRSQALMDTLLVRAPSGENPAFLQSFSIGADGEQQLKKLVINIMSLPEYQLC